MSNIRVYFPNLNSIRFVAALAVMIHHIEPVSYTHLDVYKRQAKAALEIVKENLKQSKNRVADFSNLERNGLMAKNDLLKACLLYTSRCV